MITYPFHEAHRARLPYVAAAAAAILGALYFVPSASATAGRTPPTEVRQASTTGRQQLVETGGVDATPYLVGGSAFLGMSAGLLVSARRRSQAEAVPESAEVAT